MKITVRDLQKKFDWKAIKGKRSASQSRFPLFIRKIHWKSHYFYVFPEDTSLPCIYLCFSVEQDKYQIVQLGMSHWHIHFDEFDDEEKNIAAAIALARDLIAKKQFIIERFDHKGKYMSGSLHHEKLDLLAFDQNQKASHIHEIFFNQPIKILK